MKDRSGCEVVGLSHTADVVMMVMENGISQQWGRGRESIYTQI